MAVNTVVSVVSSHDIIRAGTARALGATGTVTVADAVADFNELHEDMADLVLFVPTMHERNHPGVGPGVRKLVASATPVLVASVSLPIDVSRPVLVALRAGASAYHHLRPTDTGEIDPGLLETLTLVAAGERLTSSEVSFLLLAENGPTLYRLDAPQRAALQYHAAGMLPGLVASFMGVDHDHATRCLAQAHNALLGLHPTRPAATVPTATPPAESAGRSAGRSSYQPPADLSSEDAALPRRPPRRGQDLQTGDLAWTDQRKPGVINLPLPADLAHTRHQQRSAAAAPTLSPCRSGR